MKANTSHSLLITHNDDTTLITKAAGSQQSIITAYKKLNEKVKDNLAKVKSITFLEGDNTKTIICVA